MRLFGRDGESGGAEGSAEGIAAFWAWWEQARPGLGPLVGTGDVTGLAERVEPAVAALDPSLVWDVVPGTTARHALVVSAGGDPELRPLAHRWARAAPPADADWEYHPSRPAGADVSALVLDVAGRAFSLDKLVLGLRVPNGSPRVDVSVYHPLFPDLDDDTRMEAAVLALDSVLGEDEVARWVGDIVAAGFEPIDAVSAVHLPAVVADLASGYQDEQWALMEGQTATGARLLATVRHPLRPVDHPLFDQHVTVTLPYDDSDEDGLPAGGSAAALLAFEERLSGLLDGLRGDALLALHMSTEGARVYHVYADPDSDAASRVEELAATWREGTPTVDVAPDPGWLVVSPFLS
ncbi:DUF695 domain-containing protein [Sphaerisporangium sp. TRM90804]|uniref:DUF695 domain-containing protein n=1 Tax=Sphaerisporangium sp. TRM90804 TaxID=3031113 RepID=UPI002448A52D|nr:DUF695 domain-containing protein [Sphaerisporangium sp. TRM90804]MDH2427649.1 DUF695 domain-containing protein [Sphaerisporangium sp. TRM90804]